MLFDIVGAPECQMLQGPACTAETHNHGTYCMGQLSNGTAQLLPSVQSVQRSWIEYVHSLGMPIHAWTIRNEARALIRPDLRRCVAQCGTPLNSSFFDELRLPVAAPFCILRW